MFNNNLSKEGKEALDRELLEWEQEMGRNPVSNAVPVRFDDDIDSEQYFTKQESNSHEQRAKRAEAERNKGNEAMKSKDFDEAIGFYTRSLELDDRQPASFCNRALAFLKKNGGWFVIQSTTGWSRTAATRWR